MARKPKPVEHNIYLAEKEGRQRARSGPILPEYRVESVQPVGTRGEEDLEAVARYVGHWIGDLPESEHEQAWADVGGALLGKQWPQLREKVT